MEVEKSSNKVHDLRPKINVLLDKLTIDAINNMTMHWNVVLTTLNTKKKKIKRKSDSFYEKGWKEQNKFWKKHKLPTMELSEYIDYVHGKWKPTQQPLKRMDLWNPTTTEPMTRETKLPQPKLSNRITRGNVTGKRHKKD